MSASRIYPHALAALQNGDLDWETANLKGLLVSSAFVYDSSKVYRDELSESSIIATSSAMTEAERVGSLVTGDALAWLQLADHRIGNGVVLFDDTGDDAYSQLIAYFDAEYVEGLPSPLEGADYYLYPVTPPGGFFQFGVEADFIGMLNSYLLAYNLALNEILGDTVAASIPTLVFGLALPVKERACLLPDELDSDSCCGPTIRSSSCE